MPQLVRTPEEILRETKRDLYFIRFHEAGWLGPWGPVTARSEVEAWFAEHLPHIAIEPMGPSELSGILSGGCDRDMYVDFDEAALKHFVEVWENPDGSYKDPRWTCYYMSYEAFMKTSPVADGPHPLDEDEW